jgi:hypothetical protein
LSVIGNLYIFIVSYCLTFSSEGKGISDENSNNDSENVPSTSITDDNMIPLTGSNNNGTVDTYEMPEDPGQSQDTSPTVDP